jgi:hypothetical protein
MTADEINALPAGPDMDLAVAKIIRGSVCRCWLCDNTLPDGSCRNCGGRPRPNYSADMAAAWAVALWLREQSGTVEFGMSNDENPSCYCLVGGVPAGDDWPMGTGDTMPLAICRAALIAKGRCP